MKMMNKPVASSGKVWFQSPNKFRRELQRQRAQHHREQRAAALDLLSEIPIRREVHARQTLAARCRDRGDHRQPQSRRTSSRPTTSPASREGNGYILQLTPRTACAEEDAAAVHHPVRTRSSRSSAPKCCSQTATASSRPTPTKPARRFPRRSSSSRRRPARRSPRRSAGRDAALRRPRRRGSRRARPRDLDRATPLGHRSAMSLPYGSGCRDRRLRRLHVLVEEFEDRLVGANLVLLFGEAVAFVVEDDVFDDAVLLLDRLDDLV